MVLLLWLVLPFAAVAGSRFQPPFFYPLHMPLADNRHILLYPHVASLALLCVTFMEWSLISGLGPSHLPLGSLQCIQGAKNCLLALSHLWHINVHANYCCLLGFLHHGCRARWFHIGWRDFVQVDEFDSLCGFMFPSLWFFWWYDVSLRFSIGLARSP